MRRARTRPIPAAAAAAWLSLSLLALAGCTEEPPPVCEGWDALDAGEVTASVTTAGLSGQGDGTWEAGAATYVIQPSEVMVNVGRTGAWGLTLHAVTDVTGAAVTERVAAGEYPIEVVLGERDADGGEAFVMSSSSDQFYTGEIGTGTLTLAGPGTGDGTLSGCFSLTATDLHDDSRQVTMDGGLLHLQEM